MPARKIIYVTGTRADYGLMRRLLGMLHESKEFDLSLCVTGMHLSNQYGNTIDEIERDGFKIAGTIRVDVDSSTKSSMSKSIGNQIIGFTEVFAAELPDAVLLLGDRGEMLAGAIAAIHLNIPIVHLHGGERSGTVDEMIRHAISKLSHYHFVSTEGAKQRLIQMGEHPNTIFKVGAPGLDDIVFSKQNSKEEFIRKYQLDMNKKTALLVFHPVVQEYDNLQSHFYDLFEAILATQLQVICLEPNSDAGGHLIREALAEYSDNPHIKIFKHLNRAEYINCLAHCDVMIGNSSSGIIEAASFNLVVVNVGNRQNLRECGDNVIHSDNSQKSILDSIQMALDLPRKKYINIYGDGNTSVKCLDLLHKISLDSHILNKYNAY